VIVTNMDSECTVTQNSFYFNVISLRRAIAYTHTQYQCTPASRA